MSHRCLLVAVLACAACKSTLPAASTPSGPAAPTADAAPTPAAGDLCADLGVLFQSAQGGFAEYVSGERTPPAIAGSTECEYFPADDGSGFAEEAPARVICTFFDSTDRDAGSAIFLALAEQVLHCSSPDAEMPPDDGRDVYELASASDPSQPVISIEREAHGASDDPSLGVYVTVSLAVPDEDGDE